MNSKEIVIIGAGAAGSTAAFHLAKTGHKVTLLEKNSAPQVKPCGGGMAAAVQEWFPFDLKPAVEDVISKVEFSWCLKDPVIAALPGSAPFWIVKREKLDSLIMDHAINLGTDFINGFEAININRHNSVWEIKASDGRELIAKAVIIADGSQSIWPSKIGLGPKNQHHAQTISVRLKGKGNLKAGTARFEFGLVHHGFAWAFPLANEVNIGVGTFIGNHSIDSKEILNKLLPNLGFNPTDGERREAKLRVWNGHHKLHGEGILVIGDAASICDPFLAEGLRPALMSGYEAAKSLDHWIRGETMSLDIYTQSMKDKWGDSMAWGRRIAQVFYRFPKVGYQLGIKRPTAPQRIAQILSGKMGYGDIAQRVIKRLLLKSQ